MKWLKFKTLTGHSDHVTDVVFSPDGTYLISCSWDGTVRVWSTETWDLVENLDLKKITDQDYIQVHKAWIAPDNDTLTVLHGAEVSIWRISSLNKPLNRSRIGLSRDAVLSRDGRKLYTIGYSGSVDVRDGHSFDLLHELVRHRMLGSSLALSSDGKWLATGGSYEDRRVRIWNTQSIKEVHVLKELKDETVNLAFSPDGRYLVSENLTEGWSSHSINPSRLIVWNTGNWKEIASFQSEQSGALLFSKDGSVLFAATHRNQVIAWDVLQGSKIFTLKGGHYNLEPDGEENKAILTSLDISPDSTIIATGSYDTTIQLWKIDSHRD